jgi:glycosyltransferase involved in cell wall biosynthesis
MSATGITIAIPTHNRAEELRLTLAGFARLRTEGAGEWEVLVVANNCTDGTHEVVRSLAVEFGGRLRCVDESRPGLNHARNRAIADARHDVIAFLDDDVDLDPGWLRGLCVAIRDLAAAGQDWAAIGGRALLVYPGPRPAWLPGSAEGLLSKIDCGPDRRPATVDEVFGLNMVLRREWVQRVGGFRGDMDRVGKCLISGGDTDLVQRVSDAGGKLFYEPAACLGHRVAPGRLRRRWFLSRCYWGGRSNARMLTAEELNLVMALRLATYVWTAFRRTAGAVLRSGVRSPATFAEVNRLASKFGQWQGMLIEYVSRRRRPEAQTVAPAPAAGFR